MDGSDCEFDCGPAVSIWEDFSSSSVAEVWQHMKEHHDLDFAQLTRAIPGFSDYHRIVAVNALRAAFKAEDSAKEMELTMAMVFDPNSRLWEEQQKHLPL